MLFKSLIVCFVSAAQSSLLVAGKRKLLESEDSKEKCNSGEFQSEATKKCFNVPDAQKCLKEIILGETILGKIKHFTRTWMPLLYAMYTGCADVIKGLSSQFWLIYYWIKSLIVPGKTCTTDTDCAPSEKCMGVDQDGNNGHCGSKDKVSRRMLTSETIYWLEYVHYYFTIVKEFLHTHLDPYVPVVVSLFSAIVGLFIGIIDQLRVVFSPLINLIIGKEPDAALPAGQSTLPECASEKAKTCENFITDNQLDPKTCIKEKTDE